MISLKERLNVLNSSVQINLTDFFKTFLKTVRNRKKSKAIYNNLISIIENNINEPLLFISYNCKDSKNIINIYTYDYLYNSVNRYNIFMGLLNEDDSKPYFMYIENISHVKDDIYIANVISLDQSNFDSLMKSFT